MKASQKRRFYVPPVGQPDAPQDPPDGPRRPPVDIRNTQGRPTDPQTPPRGPLADPRAGAKEEPKEGWEHLVNAG